MSLTVSKGSTGSQGRCGAKNNEAPRSFDSISRRRHLERSREILLAGRSACQLRYSNHRLLLIPNPQLLITAFKLSPCGVLPFDCLRKRGSRFYR